MNPSPLPQPSTVVRAAAIRAYRFAGAKTWHRSLPRADDIGIVIEAHASTAPACEVERSDPEAGETTRLEVLHPDEIEPAQA